MRHHFFMSPFFGDYMANRRINKTCILDSTRYSYCSHCGKQNIEDYWKTLYCSENCRTIFSICSEFAMNNVDAKTANKILSECDLSNFDKYSDSTKDVISKIKLEGLDYEQD